MFSAALATLSAANSASVTTQLAAWTTAGGGFGQVAVNVQAETALDAAAFVSLLQMFCAGLSSGGDATGAWVSACRAHQRRGAVMPPPVPAVIGRALPIRSYANLISDAHATSGTATDADDDDDDGVDLSADYVETMLREEANHAVPVSARQRRLIQAAPVGRFLIWATFCAAAPGDSPFDHLPKSTDAVRTALGLGECPETETLILISYGTAGGAPPFDLHRPTVADAAAYCWFRPCAAGNVHGWTGPLPPNPANLAPQPEVVHRETTGATLIFPFYLVV